MVKKVIKLALFVLILWFAASVLYYMSAEQKVQKQLQPAFGNDYSVKLENFDDWYLQSDSRTARVIVSTKTGYANSAWTFVIVGGRFFPETVNLGNTEPLRSVVGDLVDKIGEDTRAERARQGIDETIIEE